MGSTLGVAFMTAYNQDHPHIHGEHGAGFSVAPWSTGSPPYTWGALSGLE